MSRDPSHRWPTTKELAQQSRVEKRVWKFLAGLSHQATVVTSVRVALLLADRWDIAKAEIDGRGENPFRLPSCRQGSAVAGIGGCQIVLEVPFGRPVRMSVVARMVADDVSADVAAFLAVRLAKEICWKERF